MFERPGKLSDHFPAPYKNEEQARSINNGALPPDLSLIVKARGRKEDYLFALLTGYRETPAGVTVNNAAGQYYNPYFAGGKIGMAKQLVDGAVEYPDGTPATESQMAKVRCSLRALRCRLGRSPLPCHCAPSPRAATWHRRVPVTPASPAQHHHRAPVAPQ